jgi:hypothetical protein
MEPNLIVLLVVLSVGVFLQTSALKNFWGARRKRGSLLVSLLSLVIAAQTAERIQRTLSRLLVFLIGCGLVGLAGFGLYNYVTAQRSAPTSLGQPSSGVN